MRGVPEDRAARDLHAAMEFLRSQSNVKQDRIGSIGWCIGGGYSLNVALEEPTLAATVINYGHLATRFCEEDQCFDPRNLRRAGPWYPCRRRKKVPATAAG